MVPALREAFNRNFTPEKYQQFLRALDDVCGTHIEFPVSETPCFVPRALLDEMAEYGRDLVLQLTNNPDYRRASDASVPALYNVANESALPMFVAVDFGLVRGANGELEPKLVELQGFPSLYAYQALISQVYQEVFELDENLQYLLSGLDWEDYKKLLRRAVVADHDPENVILMEIDPLQQKTLPDFLLTEKLLGIKTVSITDIKKRGKELFYDGDGKRIPIHRIYNRAIVDEIIRKNIKLDFRFTDDLQVEWAGHPNWFFRMSKFSLPFLKHASVPQSWFLDRVEKIPDDLEHYILKPLFSFAGLGVMINLTKADIDAIPQDRRSQYILQEKMNFAPVIETPLGGTKAEIRVMYIWLDELMPVMSIIRMGRGLMMGVDHNRNMEWVGSSAGFYASVS